MSKFSRRIVCALITAVLATALTATNATATESAPTGPTLLDPNFEKPTVGECRNYGLGAVAGETNSSPVVGCGTTHTSKVIAAPLLPDALTWESSDEAIHLAMVKACLPAYRTKLGRTESLRQKSAYEIAWYEPTQTQKDNGARWLRCDLILYGGFTLQSITRNATPILPAAPLPKSVKSCLAGPDDSIRLTVCTKNHRYRATGTYLVERTYYPGRDGLIAIANRRCPSLVSTPHYWWAYWMDRNSWKAGDHTITCYSHTSS
jgi:hypothetical protein